MKLYRLILVTLLIAVTVVSFYSTNTKAEPSCVDAPQPNGTIWRTCVGDDGRTYCEECSNGVCSRVSCNGGN